MKLIADAGASKIAWVLINKGQIFEFKTSGYNPNIADSNYLRQLLISGFPSEFNPTNVLTVMYFGAGCGSDFGKERVKKALISFFTSLSKINILTDLEGAAKACFKKSQGIIGILGTGVNAGFYNGTEIETGIPSLGFLLGDEGSGAYLGKKLVAKIIRNELSNEVVEKFFSNTSFSPLTLVQKIYETPHPNRFLASLTPFLKENIKDDQIENLVINGFEKFFNYFISPLVSENGNSDSWIVGGVAFAFKEQLNKVFNEKGLTQVNIIQSPIKMLIENT